MDEQLEDYNIVNDYTRIKHRIKELLESMWYIVPSMSLEYKDTGGEETHIIVGTLNVYPLQPIDYVLDFKKHN